MAGDAVFRVAADVAEYITGMAKADAANKKVARSAAGIGDQIGASIIKIELLNRALNAAGRAITGVLDKATSSSVSAGDRAIGLATSLGSLGVRDINGMTNRMSGGSGGTTPEVKASFAKSLAGVNRQRRTPMSGGEAEAALNAFAQFGEFGFGEGGTDLLEGLSNGQSLSSLTAAAAERAERVRVAQTDYMSPLHQGMRGRSADINAQREEEERFLVSGTSQRVDRAGARITAANDPGGPVSIINGALGENAGTFVDKAIKGMVGGDGLPGDAGFTAAQSLTRAVETMSRDFRKLTMAPNFATETR